MSQNLITTAKSNELSDLFGDSIIDAYTDRQAIEDGVLADVTAARVEFRGKPVNRITGTLFDGWQSLHPDTEDADAITTETLQRLITEAVNRAELKGGIHQTTTEGGTALLWLMENETGGITLMYPEDY
jgi:hypothetical protein